MRSVRFVLPRQLDVNISHFMSRPAPNLSILHITFTVPPSEGWSPGFVRIPDCPFQGQHRLEEVAIRNCDIPWDTPLFAGLRRLTIDRVSIAECMQPDHLFSILETCSALEDLDLRGCNMLAPRSADVSTRTVSLPRLRSFTFMSDKLSSDAYLGYILAPRDVSVRVRCGTYAGLDAALRIIPSSAASHNLAPPLQTSLSRCRRLVLSSPAVSGYGIDATWITCTRSHKFTVEFGHHGVELSGRLDVLADSLPLAAHLESLHIDRLAFGADTAPPLARLICGIPNLKHITFSACPFGSEDAVFDILAETAWGPSINHITLSESRSVLQSLVRSIIQSRVVGDDASQAPSKPRISLHQCGRIVAGTVEALGDVARVDWRE
ncbi:hypothetical protein BOTBODRAFT_143699 [Botryobasidium botryosum FD-172 SS1]|uniref:F-box domain-containing protein n=1 Tax=Botryobasidium botryosum (strain FD-172 SS1) TaxID=930990 RepID=A0A067MQY3_BOTB1|nr:hypothetical protein BOTBODRAFT_143699 [Botryobasidium botryosum FD-172 SS1]